MRITDVEALHLRQPQIDTTVADGSQDALIIRIHTDEGIIGVGEVDSMPPVIKAIVDAPASHKIANGLRSLLVGRGSVPDRAAVAEHVRGLAAITADEAPRFMP